MHVGQMDYFVGFPLTCISTVHISSPTKVKNQKAFNKAHRRLSNKGRGTKWAGDGRSLTFMAKLAIGFR